MFVCVTLSDCMGPVGILSSLLPQAVTGPGGTFSGWSVGGLGVVGLAVQAQDILTHLEAQTHLRVS